MNAQTRSATAASAILLAGLLFQAAAASGPQSFLRATEAYNSGKLQEAVRLYKRASLEGDNPVLCYFNAANAYFQLDSLPQALVYYRACIDGAPDFTKGYLNLAVVYYMLDDMGACIATVRQVLEKEPDHQKARLIHAAALRRCGAISEAVVEFERLARTFPEMEEPYVALGEIYRDLGDQQTAIDWLMAYPQQGKNFNYIWLLLADLCETVGDLPRAVYYLQQSFTLDRTKKWTLYRLAALQEKMGNELVALETAREAVELFPKFAEAATLAGNLAFNRHRYEEADKFYAAGAKLGDPNSLVGQQNVRAVRKQSLPSD